MSSSELSISVITATWNAEKQLPRLIESLQNQVDKNFNWVVADGDSSDGTLDLIRKSEGLAVSISSQPDWGIYDALNRAVRLSIADYYLVIGADDWLAPDAIENYRKAAIEANKPDLVSAAVLIGSSIVNPKSGMGWLYGMPGEASSHSVGTLIKRSLHDKFGLYSRKFPIAADQLFVKTILKNEGSIVRCNFVAGEFSIGGTSGQDDWGMITELFRVQIKTEQWIFLQVVFLFLRSLKCYVSHVIRSKKNE